MGCHPNGFQCAKSPQISPANKAAFEKEGPITAHVVDIPRKRLKGIQKF